MSLTDRERLREIRSFPSLVRYLRDELDWPITTDDFEELTFDYTPEELGIDPKNAAKIQEIKRLRPLSKNQPWGIFFVKFEPKRLPVVALRRILSQVVIKKRASANKSDRASWGAEDLLFISNYGEGKERQISFAHFSQDPNKKNLATLKVLGWDNLDTPLHLDVVAKELTEGLVWPGDEVDIPTWRSRWSATFKLRHGEVIEGSKQLSTRLAELARAIRDRTKTALAIETEDGPLRKLMKAFREALVHDLDADGFADMYAQTIAYGLLSARIADPQRKTADDFAGHMRTNPFLRELMEAFLDVGGRLGKKGGASIDFDELGVGEVIELLDEAKLEAVVMDFGDLRPEEDPVIHFYELFLKEYDAEARVRRGVFYTPRPVVSYIVRSVDELFRKEFGLEDGLADITTWGEMAKRHRDLEIPKDVQAEEPFVQILDPACGTGTFLVEVIDLIHKTMFDKWQAAGHGGEEIAALWNEYVPNQLLPRLHGYELLMAPYAIAHLKFGLKLFETGYHFGSDERARIYLTNALEPASDIGQQRIERMLSALALEATAVNKVKRQQQFTVVIGNPPYSKSSSNRSEAAESLVTEYKRLVHGETNVQPLSDDYVKFLALALKISNPSASLIGLITNRSYLGGLIHRGMRSTLCRSCSNVFVVDLHGDSNVGEAPPYGRLNENIFDIKQGVAISIFVRSSTESSDRVYRQDVWGSRAEKYQTLIEEDVRTNTARLAVSAPYWFFVDQDLDSQTEQASWIPVNLLFGIAGMGVKSRRDHFLVDEREATLRERMSTLAASKNPESLRHELRVTDNPQWTLEGMSQLLRREGVDHRIVPITYRPFDTRFIWYHPAAIERGDARWPVMRHVLPAGLSLLTARQSVNQDFSSVFVSRGLSEMKTAESTRGSYVFPLRLTDGTLSTEQATSNIRTELLGPSLSTRTPEEILSYVYSVLHSPRYRTRYAGALRIEFPRVPENPPEELAGALCALGAQLVALHLMGSPKLDQFVTTYFGPQTPKIGRVGWSSDTVWLDTPPTKKGPPTSPGSAGFVGVTESVWTFRIGGYQVCQKWLKDRKDRQLTTADIDHYQKIVVAISETIRLMGEIDAVIESHGGWPSAFRTDGSQASSTPTFHGFTSKIVKPSPEDRYVTTVPLVPLKIAAGAFGGPQHMFDDEDSEWIAIKTKRKLRPGMFVAQVVGKSMEPGIPDGSYCLFTSPVTGTRQGKTVLVQLRDALDPETGERYTLKRYESEKVETDGSWRHSRITLKPTNPDFAAIELSNEDQVQVVAELIEVLKA